ncbi:hypothetical protein SPRG_08716 [Saprolegnia parasitica CBS 223.65]|uniref:Uncharacterized protein n=1 Tax=Saprolegnia parasitica (strain CBS 223.65) TaxID=695850 RepID=A0A067CGW7_SAPPC|nr:hypothetical protein SPRG_08716 [Saprolegnia parasitica CBS 223.65]KDO26062.1 hypothetical protein SPRG_08716 [Saprolegnia parasitica CBS 223.65]|eukprot:XP_012203345.1 hypothetical protein SPRG_08716 [Saprolegnia parasitica CBS 223.65]
MSAEAYVNGLLRDACANVVGRLSDDRQSIPEPPDENDAKTNDSGVGLSTCAHDMATTMTSEALELLSLGVSIAETLEPPAEDDASPVACDSALVDEPCGEIVVEPPPTTATDLNHTRPTLESKPSSPEDAAIDNLVDQAPSPVQAPSPAQAPKSHHKAVPPSTIKPAPTRSIQRPMPPAKALKQLTPPPSFASLDIYPQVLTDVAIFPASPRSDNQPDTKPPLSMPKAKKLDPIVFRGGKYQAYDATSRSDASPRARRLQADAPRAIVASKTVQHVVSGFCRQCLLYGDMRKLAECSQHNYFPPSQKRH